MVSRRSPCLLSSQRYLLSTMECDSAQNSSIWLQVDPKIPFECLCWLWRPWRILPKSSVSHVSHHLFHSLDPYLLQYYEGDNQNGETVRTKWWGGQSYRLRDQRRTHWGGDICAGTFGGWPYGEVGRTMHWNTEVHIWRPFGNTELTFWKDLTELLWWLRW